MAVVITEVGALDGAGGDGSAAYFTLTFSQDVAVGTLILVFLDTGRAALAGSSGVAFANTDGHGNGVDSAGNIYLNLLGGVLYSAANTLVFSTTAQHAISAGDTISFVPHLTSGFSGAEGYPSNQEGVGVVALAVTNFISRKGVSQDVHDGNSGGGTTYNGSTGFGGTATQAELPSESFSVSYPAYPYTEIAFMVISGRAFDVFVPGGTMVGSPPYSGTVNVYGGYPVPAAPPTPAGFTAATPVATDEWARLDDGTGTFTNVNYSTTKVQSKSFVFWKVLSGNGPYTQPAVDYPVPTYSRGGSPYTDPAVYFYTSGWFSLIIKNQETGATDLAENSVGWQYRTFARGDGTIHVERSLDNGVTWPGSVQVASGVPLDCSPTLFIDRWDTIYCLFHDGTQAAVWVSFDRGDTFSSYAGLPGRKFPRAICLDDCVLLATQFGGKLYIDRGGVAALGSGTANVYQLAMPEQLVAFAVDRRGAIHLLWEDGGALSYQWSENAAVDWSATVAVGSGSFPSLAFGLTRGLAGWQSGGGLVLRLTDEAGVSLTDAAATPLPGIPNDIFGAGPPTGFSGQVGILWDRFERARVAGWSVQNTIDPMSEQTNVWGGGLLQQWHAPS